ncbi:ABC transporter substrate-binding protein [Pleomorphochaeta sp. DL1XJH-081]|uniref:ABC transporter substrate-binding protein n=1 Tax=Pleomorphochaeta sp. DL1XJH-081 TaxID=3409690 RepID=UPI003BB4F706
MQVLKKFLLIGTVLVLLVSGCSKSTTEPVDSSPPIDNQAKEQDQLIVGFSQMNHINPWRVAETNDLRRVAQERGYSLLLTDADSSIEKQTEDIKQMIAQGAQYIVCTPLVYEGYDEIVRICKEASVPLIMLDREIKGEAGVDFLTFIGSDFYEEGVRAAQWLADTTQNTAKIVELHGNEGASCSIDRSAGFHSIIDDIEGMDVVAWGFADFERITGQDVMEDIILSYGRDFNAVYAHSDEMAIGAIQALKAASINPGKDVDIISIDGSKDALKSIIAGELGASIECSPRLGTAVFDTIEAHIAGEEIPARIIIEDRLFDPSNAEEIFHEGF